METIQAFLQEYDHIPPNKKCMALLLAEERFLKIKQTMKEEQNQPEETAAQGFIPYWNFSMIDDEEARDNFLKDVYTFLRKFSRITFGVTPKVILIAWESFGKIKDALMDKQYQQEDIQELMNKLLEDVRNIREEFSEYINCPSWNHPLFYFDNDDDEYTVIWRRPKAITNDEPSEEPEDPLIMGEEELNTIPEKDKFSVEDLVLIPSGSKGVSDDICNNSNAESLLDEFDEEEDDCYDDDTSNDDDSYENIEYIEASPLNLEIVSLEEKLLNISRLITNIESLKDNPIHNRVLKSPSSVPIPIEDSDSFFEESGTSFSYSDNFLPDIETFSDHTEETRSGSTTTHANNSLPKLPEFESFHFDLYDDPLFPRPPPEPPDVENSLIIETDAPMINNVDELNEDDDSFTFVTWIFLPYLTYPE
ncbi:hypothetical protein Tco_1425930, partial [Tanacetum coccineum]